VKKDELEVKLKEKMDTKMKELEQGREERERQIHKEVEQAKKEMEAELEEQLAKSKEHRGQRSATYTRLSTRSAGNLVHSPSTKCAQGRGIGGVLRTIRSNVLRFVTATAVDVDVDVFFSDESGEDEEPPMHEFKSTVRCTQPPAGWPRRGESRPRQRNDQVHDELVKSAVQQIAALIAGDGGHDLLVVTGAGVEDDSFEPNEVHALCSLICAQGGKHITTNISGVQLLAQPEECDERLRSGDHFVQPRLSAVEFVAIHSTIYDQKSGRHAERRRPRCLDHASQTLLQTHGRDTVCVPIPTQGPDLHVNDPNKQEAEAAVKGRTTLLIMGSSLQKSTNGKALNFLESACDVSRVFYINPDVGRPHDIVRDDLIGWGLPKLQQCPRSKKNLGYLSSTCDPTLSMDCNVQCVYMSATQFAVLVLAELPRVGMPTHLRDACLSWITPTKVSRFRALFPLPPVEHLAGICDHKFGQQGLKIKDIYDKVVDLNNT